MKVKKTVKQAAAVAMAAAMVMGAVPVPGLVGEVRAEVTKDNGDTREGTNSSQTAETVSSVIVTGDGSQTVGGVENHEMGGEAVNGMHSGVSVVGDTNNKLGGSVTVQGDIIVDNKNWTYSKDNAGGNSQGINITGENKVSGKGTVEVEGSVSVDTTVKEQPEDPYCPGLATGISAEAGADIRVGENVSAKGKYLAQGIVDGNYSGDTDVYIKVGGNITATSTNTAEDKTGDSYAQGIGINSAKNSEIEVGGAVKAEAAGNSAYGVYEGGYPGYGTTTKVTVGDGINAASDAKYAYGMLIYPGQTSNYVVEDGGVHASGKNAYGIYVYDYYAGTTVDESQSVSIDVTGDVDVKGSEAGAGSAIVVRGSDNTVSISVDGDIEGTSNGIVLTKNIGKVNISTNGTISAESGAAIAVTAAKDPDDTTKAAAGAEVPVITAWKIETGADHLVAYSSDSDKDYAAKVQSNINYIIKGSVTENGRESDNGKIVLTGTKGKVTFGDKTYETALQDETITINVETVNGYKYSLSDSQGLLKVNDDGTYTLKVPEGGGVDLKAVLEKIIEHKSSSDDDGDDSSSYSSSTANRTSASGSVAAYTGSGLNGGSSNGYSYGKWTRDVSDGSTAAGSGSSAWRFRFDNGNYASGSRVTSADGVTTEYVGWAKIGGVWYAFDADGYMAKDWVYDAATDNWYYCDENAGLQTGWHYDTVDGRRYYLDPRTGVMYTGWHTIDGKKYFFSPDHNGTYYFDAITSKWVYDNPEAKRPLGSMYQNELTPDGFSVNENGEMYDELKD